MSRVRKLNPTAKPGCLYIAGDPHVVLRGEDPFCGADRKPGSAYCDEHHDLCNKPPPVKAADVSLETGRLFR